jgi:hypothetical protein
MERGKEVKIKIERKSPYTHQIVEIENQTLIAETHHEHKEVWCTVEVLKTQLVFRTPMEGTLEISAI